jgi:hypothetical protein
MFRHPSLRHIVLLAFFCLIFNKVAIAQTTVIRGKVSEKGKPEYLPFVSVFFKGTQVGTNTDFEGNFFLKTNTPSDSLIFSYVGYKTKAVYVKRGQTQTINVELEPAGKLMDEVVIFAGENPAWRIIRKAAENKYKNNALNLPQIDYDVYTKVDASMDNISEKMKNRKVFRPIKDLFDTANQIKNEDGKYILPIYVSEVYSHYYVNNNPYQTKEIIKASDINGFLTEQGSYMLDVLGPGLFEFDFYRNWVRFLSKDFLSPIADGWNNYYKYTLIDSVEIDGTKCYQIKLRLKREEDLGFIGTIWIADTSFAIKRLDLELSQSANINFLDRMKIQQEMVRVDTLAWAVQKSRLILDLAEPTDNASGFIAKMYRSNNNFRVNNPMPPTFFDELVEKLPDMLDHDSVYWNQIRSEPFSVTEKQMINMIDSVKKVPAVKSYLTIIQMFAEGYYKAGKIDIGPNILLVGYNEVEHWRLRVGFRTNNSFSKKWYVKTYLAYGFYDEKWKYGLGIDRVLNHKKWTTIGVWVKDDYEIMGINNVSSNQLHIPPMSNLFTTLSFLSPQARLNQSIDYSIIFLTQPKRNWTYRAIFQNVYFKPVGDFVFAYKLDPNQPASPDNARSDFTYTAINLEARFAFKEVWVQRNSDRIKLQRSVFPAVTLLYSQAFKGVINGDFTFSKVQINLDHHLNTGIFGTADWNFTAGKIFGALPYPLLDVPRGNSTILYNEQNMSLMNLYEFASDEYYSFRYTQHFEGLFFNRVPIVKKWKWRNYALIKVAYGSLSQKNLELFSPVDEQGRLFSPVYRFKDDPYVEVGYGIENILRFITVGAVHRLTYLDNVNVRRWAINVGLVFQF